MPRIGNRRGYRDCRPNTVRLQVTISSIFIHSVEGSAPRAHYGAVNALEEEDRMIGQVADRLRENFPEVSGDAVNNIVGSARGQFDRAPIRDFVPLFVERQAREKLSNLTGASPNPA